MIDSEVRINFIVKGLGFPVGKIYNLHVWLPAGTENPVKWVTDNADKIKSELRDTCHVYSIQHQSTVWTNSRTVSDKHGEIIIDSTVDATISGDKEKKKKESKPVTDIRKIDLPNISKDDLNKLKTKIDIEIFKKENVLSDDVYDFFMANIDLVTVDEAKKVCEEYGTDDIFILRKKEIRKKVKEKISTK